MSSLLIVALVPSLRAALIAYRHELPALKSPSKASWETWQCSESDSSALYALPLSEFTSARNKLAKQARARGYADEAERIGRLQKPSLPAWALNMLPRLREAEFRE